MENTTHLPIKDWSNGDKPREKLIQKGRFSLSDAELIAILIGSGTRSLSAVEVSKKLLKEAASNNLDLLSKLTVNDLTRHKGIGLAKAGTIVAAMELARRRKESVKVDKPLIISSKLAFDLLRPYLSDLPHEEFFVVLLNRASKVLKVERIGVGGLTGTIADIRLMFKTAIENMATSIILAHNHPSGNVMPSEADKTLTKNVYEAGKLLSIELFDHVILGDNRYYSFADEGLLR